MLLQRLLEAKITWSHFVHASTTIWLQLPIDSESSLYAKQASLLTPSSKFLRNPSQCFWNMLLSKRDVA